MGGAKGCRLDAQPLPTQDEVISFSHGMALHERCPGSQQPLWVDGAGHNDIEMFEAYAVRLTDFLQTLSTNRQRPAPPP